MHLYKQTSNSSKLFWLEINKIYELLRWLHIPSGVRFAANIESSTQSEQVVPVVVISIRTLTPSL